MKRLGCILLVLLAGCQETMSPKECKDDHWYDRGFADGSGGKPTSEGMRLARACRAFDIDMIEDEYYRGFKAGRRTLCTPANGQLHGQHGQAMVEDCPTDLFASYQEAWQAGLRNYCKPSEGYALGNSGEMAPTFCPSDLKDAFMEAYYKGRDLRLHGNTKERSKHAIYYEIEDLNQMIAKEEQTVAELSRNPDNATRAKIKQHRAYRDHLIDKKARLERQAGIS